MIWLSSIKDEYDFFTPLEILDDIQFKENHKNETKKIEEWQKEYNGKTVSQVQKIIDKNIEKIEKIEKEVSDIDKEIAMQNISDENIKSIIQAL